MGEETYPPQLGGAARVVEGQGTFPGGSEVDFPRDMPVAVSTNSKRSGPSTVMVGCSALGGCQARKRTPATYSPTRPVGCRGSARPLQVTA